MIQKMFVFQITFFASPRAILPVHSGSPRRMVDGGVVHRGGGRFSYETYIV